MIGNETGLLLKGVGGGGGEGGRAFRSIPNLFIFAGEQFDMCTLSWHTSARAEAGLFSSCKVLNAGGVIQYDPDE